MMKRLFAAIKITPDENFLKIYFALVQGLHFAKINWVKPENMHITLKFFGETMDEKIPLIEETARESTAGFKPFNINIKNTGIFGSSYNPKVIWFGIEKSENLENLAENLLKNLDENGFLRDRQNFVPHLTIGRIKNVQDKRLFQEMIGRYKSSFIQNVMFDKVILFESLLFKTGPQYKKVSEFSLTA